MPDFWNAFIADEGRRVMLEAVGIALAAYATAWIAHLLLYLLQIKIASRTKTDLDDRIIKVIKKSVRRIINVTGLYYAVLHIEKVYEGDWTRPTDGIFFVLVVLLVTILLTDLVSEIFHWYLINVAQRTDSQIDDEVIPIVKRIVNFLLYTIATVTCLDHFEIDIKALIVSLGVGTFAVAFAAQETLANMIAGFVIMVDRPFRVGDRITITKNATSGEVLKVGLRSTRILGFDNNIVIIPNAEIVKSEIINFSYPTVSTRLKIDVDVAYGSDIDRVKEILVQIVSSFPDVMTDPAPQAYVLDFKTSSVGMTVIGRVHHYNKLWDTLDAARNKIYKTFREQGIEIPFPQTVVHLKKNNTDN